MLQIIFGPMFSGKTTELIRRMRRYNIAKKCILVGYKNDTRYGGDSVYTHSGMSMKSIMVENVSEIPDGYDVVGIDEAQFIADACKYAREASDKGIIVILAGLDSDFMRQPFGITTLVPMAESVVKLTAICSCGRDASFTARKGSSQEIEIIGGSELYEPKCRSCYLNI